MSDKPKNRSSISDVLRRSRRRSRARVRRLERKATKIAYITRTADAQLGANLYFCELIERFQERGYDTFAWWARSLRLDPNHALLVLETYRDLGDLYHSALLWGASRRTIQRLRKMTSWEIEQLERRLSHGNTCGHLGHIHAALTRSAQRRRNRRK